MKFLKNLDWKRLGQSFIMAATFVLLTVAAIVGVIGGFYLLFTYPMVAFPVLIAAIFVGLWVDAYKFLK